MYSNEARRANKDIYDDFIVYTDKVQGCES